MKLKQPFRRLLSLLLLTTSLLSALPLHAETFTIGPLTYSTISSDDVRVDKCAQNASGKLIIPETVTTDSGSTYSVKEIYEYAFSGCSNLTSLTIPGSVTNIGECAFNGCKSIRQLVICDGDNSLCLAKGKYVNVTTDKWGYSYSHYYSIFNDCPIETLYIGRNIQTDWSSKTKIDGPFQGKAIKSNSVTFGEKVTYITADMFKYCGGLTSVNIPNSVTTIGESAFESCGLTSVNIPNSVTIIGDYAFNRCHYLSSVTIPNSVTTIGNCAFNECHRLGSVTIPGSVTNLNYTAFSNCDMSKIYLYGKYNPNYSSNKLDADTVYTFHDSGYDYSNTHYLDFLQQSHIHGLLAGIKIDYNERFENFGVDGYEIKSLNVRGNDVSLKTDGKYLIEHSIGSIYSCYVTMVYYDPRAQRDVTTQYICYPPQELKFMNDSTTQSTMSFEVQKDESVEFSKIEFSYYGVDGLVKQSVNPSDHISLGNLRVGMKTPLTIVVHKADGEIHTFNQAITTKDIEISSDREALSPTAIDLQWSYDAGDAANQVTEVRYAAPTEQGEIEDNRFYYSGTSLPAGSTVTVTYFVNTKGKNYQKTETFTLPALVLNTVNAKAMSNDCAIICAETNMSEAETNCGFEWRRYDAPDLVPSNFVNCPVNNGMMAGKLQGLSANTYYKYRPFYEDMNGNKTYGEWTAFGTADAYVYFEPTVYTYAPTRVARTSAVITGYALGGSDDVIEQGFEYSVVTTSRAAGEPVRVPATGTRMTATLTDLLPGTTYSVRAYATTAKETTYGEEQRFTTEGEEQDAIEVVEVEEADGFDVYTLSGVCVRRNATDMSGLRPGIYIANGRKFIVR